MQIARWTSRKFILSVIAALIILFNEVFNWQLDKESLTQILQALFMFIGAEGLADIIGRWQETKPKA